VNEEGATMKYNPAWYFLGVLISMFAVSAFDKSFHLRDSPSRDSEIFLEFGLLYGFVGGVCFCLGRSRRDIERVTVDLTKRVTEQDERIRRLEEQIAALTPPPTH
jgi:hypothetical protein